VRRAALWAQGAAALACVLLLASLGFGRAAEPGLRDAAAFAAIGDPGKRSVALFEEAGKVIESPRCLNCHPAGDRPTQGADMRPHIPPVARGEAGLGAPGMECGTCHLQDNAPIRSASLHSAPGNPAWRLAPRNLGWQGKPLGDICRDIKDPRRNGGKSLAQVHAFLARDALVAWAWKPGAGRAPAPGAQARFGALIQAWIDSGAACPD
jgi:hypothetical protein